MSLCSGHFYILYICICKYWSLGLNCVTAFGQSSLSWNKASVWVLRRNFYYCQTVGGLLIWSALSDDRTGLSFRRTAGPRQRIHFRIRFPWDLQPYFTVSNSILPFSSPHTTRSATVEVFDPASSRFIYVCK
jgi:hypothetical protein